MSRPLLLLPLGCRFRPRTPSRKEEEEELLIKLHFRHEWRTTNNNAQYMESSVLDPSCSFSFLGSFVHAIILRQLAKRTNHRRDFFKSRSRLTASCQTGSLVFPLSFYTSNRPEYRRSNSSPAILPYFFPSSPLFSNINFFSPSGEKRRCRMPAT